LDVPWLCTTFAGDPGPALLVRILNEPAPKITSLQSDLPPAIVEIIDDIGPRVDGPDVETATCAQDRQKERRGWGQTPHHERLQKMFAEDPPPHPKESVLFRSLRV